ncbi:MAG: ABC transporter permease [Ruminococcus sp.]|nr:ABC transporter permease [Ruminococcus sp.]
MTALIKDALREIPRSFGRFMSMLLIILVGCGFFTGLRASRSDMILTAREYFEESRLMDLRLRSGIGIRSDEISAVRSAENVKGAYAGYTKDLFYHYDDQNIVVKAFSLTESVTEDSPHYLNRTVLLEGRMPESSDECVVERKMSSPDTFRVGNSITLISPDAPMDEVLAQDTFKIVGIVISPVFIGFERDASLVGNGSVNSNIFLMESAFRLDYYTDMYVALEGTEGMDPFSEEYRKACEKLGEPAMNAFRQSLQKRYDKLKSDAENKIKTAEDTIALTEKVLSASPEELEMLHRQASAALDNAKETYGESESIIAKAAIVNAEKKLRMLEELMADETGSVRAELMSQTESARSDIEKGRKQLKEAPELRTLCETRFAQNDYSSYRDDADKIYNVSKAFPLFFVLIAALICVNAMTRMVEEQRTVIGAYKALGYGSGMIMLKYLIYGAAASAAGSLLGSALGLKVIPYIIIKTYRIMYNIPGALVPFRPVYALMAFVVSLVLTSAAAVFSCYSELKAQPSFIMRPKPPKNGKRVLLEKVPAVWSRLSFVSKVTLRNLLRYKKRFVMTVVGVAGCMALIVTGFGLRYSVASIIDIQFGEIFRYDAAAALNTSAEHPEEALSDSDISGYMPAVSKIVTSGSRDRTFQTTLLAPKGELDGYILTESADGEKLSLSEGAVITEKLSKMSGIKKGDMITVTDAEGAVWQFEVSGIMRNHALNYVIVSEEEFVRVTGEDPVYSVAFINTKDGIDEDALRTRLIAGGGVLGVSFMADQTRGFYSQVKSLNTIVILLIVCAALLAVTVLYNLADINITERRRELATIKVLGFFDNETVAYVCRENALSTAVGILLGLGAGKFLHLFVTATVEVEAVMFNRHLVWWAYLLGAAMTALFSFAVNFILYFKLKKIDMVESLKSVE